MKKNNYIVLIAFLLLLLGGGATWMVAIWPIQRTDWWLEHRYPGGPTNLLPNEQRYFSSPEDWKQAGLDIPGIDHILVRKYEASKDEFEKKVLIYAMGTIAKPKSIECLLEIVNHSTNSELERYALFYGLIQNMQMEAIQVELVRLMRNPKKLSASNRCITLFCLLSVQNSQAIDYAKKHGMELVNQVEAEDVIPPHSILIWKKELLNLDTKRE